MRFWRRTLTVMRTGTGSGPVTSSPAGITCSPSAQDCSETYPTGTVVTLTVTLGTGEVVTWSGACTGATCTVTMDADKTATYTGSTGG